MNLDQVSAYLRNEGARAERGNGAEGCKVEVKSEEREGARCNE